MASLVPLASLIVPIIGIAAAGMRTAGTVVQYQQRQAETQAQQQVVQEQAHRDQVVVAEDLNTLHREKEVVDHRRRDALRRAVARRRASLGGRGTSAGQGSGEALLLGLVNDSAIEAADLNNETRERHFQIAREHDHRQRLNLLERSRLAGRSRLNSLAAAGDMLSESGNLLARTGSVINQARSLY